MTEEGKVSINIIGQSIQRIDSIDKVTGKALYPGDFKFPNQCYMKTVFAERPHAIIRNINTSESEAYPGVLLVLTAKDVPNNEYGLIVPDQPVLCGPGSNKNGADHVRFVGDQVALIIAEDEKSAEDAGRLLKIEYVDLPVIDDIDQSLNKNAEIIHPEKETNVYCTFKIIKGDIKTAFSTSEVIIEGEYDTPVQEHIFLQPESGVSYIDDEGRVTVIVSGQWAHEDQEQIAHALNLPIEKVRVIYPAIGGAFGGREDMSVQISLALAAYRLHEKGINRPVKTVWSRRESIIGHHKRHPYRIKTKWGATKQGKILAVETQIIADAGAYAYTSSKVLANATLLSTGPYFVPNVNIDAKAVYTNNIPNGAFRGFGGPQACFAVEMQMNKLAEALNLDPVEIRMLNAIQEGEALAVGTPLPEGISIKEVIEKCAMKAGWGKLDNKWQRNKESKDLDSKDPKHGIGFSAGYKNVGFSFGAPENCWARVEIFGTDEIEKVILKHAGADVGQGAHSVFVQYAANVLNIPPQLIHLVASDTAETMSSGSASASRMTFMAGNAIIGAAKEALEKWENEERPAISEYIYHPPATTPFDPETGYCMPNFAYGYVAEAVEVAVDEKSGKIHVVNVICANDVGKAVNPLQVKGQIEGAIVQAYGYSLLEKFIQKQGKVLTDSMATYLIPTIMDIPETMQSIIVEHADPIGPNGARGMGEMPFLNFAPALISAVHDATGIWFDSFPLTEEVVLKGLGVIE